jgi:stearoyl-CoA desaturase (delta-9 desaturase)
MSRGWEKVFYIGCFLTQGSSYISAYTYGLMHRLYHAHTDTPDDPHSPQNSPNMLMMMWDTRNSYFDLYSGNTDAEDKYKKGLPDWPGFEKIAHNWIARVAWIAVYVLIYAWLATAWWQFLFLPVTIIMGSLQGAAINWWAHRFGYENFTMTNTSKNILPFDLVFWGEAYHNNHHQHPTRPNSAVRWFEWDMGYYAMRLLDKIGIIQMKGSPQSAQQL